MRYWLAILCLTIGRLTAAEPFLEKVDVFPANQNGVTLHRIPGLVVTTSGTVLAYCEARKNSKADWGEIEIHMRRSMDGGKSWHPNKWIAHHGVRYEGNPKKSTGGEREQTVNNPVAIVDRHTGSIEFLYCVNYARCFSMKSLDDGQTWSQPKEITDVFESFRSAYDWKVIATGPGHGIQLASGRLVVPIWLAYGKAGDHAPSASATIYSDDRGATWHAGDIAVPNQGEFSNPNETMLTQLTDGRVLLVNRNVSKPNRKLITMSQDGATGWTIPAFHPNLWEPVCMASVLQHPSGLLLFSCPRSLQRDAQGKEVPSGRGKREKLTIQWSTDAGLQWSDGKLLESGPSAYSDLGFLNDGTILCLYEGSNTIQMARMNPEWLMAK